jgi:FkbM family methyltransferase
VLDLGAHIGTFTIPFAHLVGPSGKVIAVEAHRRYFELLLENLRGNQLDDRVQAINAAVAPRGARYTLKSQSSNSGATRLARRKPWRRAPTTVGIDEIVSSTAIPDLIKIDIEGLEHSVLADSQVVRERRPALYAEVSAPQLITFGSSVGAFDSFLGSLGYRLFRNTGERNAHHDRFYPSELASLTDGGDFFDVLALPPGHDALQAFKRTL